MNRKLKQKHRKQRLYFFFNDTATTEIYTLSLHDALPILTPCTVHCSSHATCGRPVSRRRDRKSTRLNSSHGSISYAVFCLRKKMSERGFLCYPIATRETRASGSSPVLA